MLHDPVALWTGDASWTRRAEDILACSNVQCIPVAALADMPARAGVVDLCVVGGRIAEACAPALRIRALASGTSVVVVDSDTPTIPLPTDWSRCRTIRDLPRAVFRTRIAAWRRRLIGRIRSAPHLSFVLREALVAAVEQEVPEDVDEAGLSRTIAHTARTVGVTREHLSRVATRQGVDLRRFADSATCMTLLTAHVVDASSWSSLACRMGFQSQSAVTALVKRTLGTVPTAALAQRSLDEWLNWWEEIVLGPLLNADHVE